MPEIRPNSRLVTLLVVIAVCAGLFLGREVLMPLAFAALLAFAIAPVVIRLERLGLPRHPAVLISALGALVLAAGVLYVVAVQLVDLAVALPGYKHNLHEKVAAFQTGGNSVLRRALETIQDLSKEISDKTALAPSSPAKPPLAVEVVDGSSSALRVVRDMSVSIFGPLGTAAIVALFVVFMLIDRQNMRDRFIHLVGAGQLRVTTTAIDDAAQRVSRYLVSQATLNATFGLAIGLGLYFIGIPNAALWGILAAALRFIPYFGALLASVFPILLSFAISPGWLAPGLTVLLFFAVEMVAANVIEPWLYGSKTGLSPMAIIVASVFWAWLWGPAGLLLATPLTVCVAVLGKYVPSLAFLHVLLSDKSPVAPESRFYQRLLAGDEMELGEIATDFEERDELGEFYDGVVLPTLRHVEEDFGSGALDRSHRSEIYDRLRAVLLTLDGFGEECPLAEATVIFVPARTEGDELAGALCSHLVRVAGGKGSAISASVLNSEIVAHFHNEHVPLLVVSALSPPSVRLGKTLARRLSPHAQRTMLGIWAAIDETTEALASGDITTSAVAVSREAVGLAKPAPKPVETVG